MSVLLSGAAGCLRASDLVNFSVEIDGWTMLPIAENGATTHIIAARNDDEALSTDIDVVLYEKTTNGWEGAAYDPSVTKEDAMIDLADEFGLSDPFGGEWQIDLDADDVLEFVLPRVGFGKGFFVTDPLYAVAQLLENPEPLAEAAEGSGEAAGSSAINTGNVSSGTGGSDAGGPQSTDCGCENACIQTAIAVGADIYLAADPTSQIEADDALDAADLAIETYLQTLFPCCRRRTVTNTFNSGSWVCGPWVPTGPASPVLLSEGLWVCEYTRTSTRNQTRTRIRTCWDCTRCTWRENRTQTHTESYSSEFYSIDNPPACPGPTGAPSCSSITANPSGSWTPATPPCCP